MAALAPSPEDAKKQEDGADDLANPTHGRKTIPGSRAQPWWTPPCPWMYAASPVPVNWECAAHSKSRTNPWLAGTWPLGGVAMLPYSWLLMAM